MALPSHVIQRGRAFLFKVYPFKKNNFIGLVYLWMCWVFIALCRLPLGAVSGDSSSLLGTGFSLWGLLCRGTRLQSCRSQ